MGLNPYYFVDRFRDEFSEDGSRPGRREAAWAVAPNPDEGGGCTSVCKPDRAGLVGLIAVDTVGAFVTGGNQCSAKSDPVA
jgi:hypothetical protein